MRNASPYEMARPQKKKLKSGSECGPGSYKWIHLIWIIFMRHEYLTERVKSSPDCDDLSRCCVTKTRLSAKSFFGKWTQMLDLTATHTPMHPRSIASQGANWRIYLPSNLAGCHRSNMNHFYPKRTIMFRQSPYRCSCSAHTSRWLPICCWQRRWALSSGTGRNEILLVSSASIFPHRENQLRHHHHVLFFSPLGFGSLALFFGRMRRRQPLPNFLMHALAQP